MGFVEDHGDDNIKSDLHHIFGGDGLVIILVLVSDKKEGLKIRAPFTLLSFTFFQKLRPVHLQQIYFLPHIGYLMVY